MEIAEPRRKYRKRRIPRDESAQPSAFPSTPNAPAAERIETDAAEKDSVKKAVAAIPEIFTPEMVGWLFDVYVGIISFVYSLILKVDFNEISKELEFTEEQKELMSKPLARILSKHAPASWAGISDEIQLITQIGIWTVVSFKRAKMVQDRIAEKKKDAERTTPVAPMRREAQTARCTLHANV
jgi:hypothetical protein